MPQGGEAQEAVLALAVPLAHMCAMGRMLPLLREVPG